MKKFLLLISVLFMWLSAVPAIAGEGFYLGLRAANVTVNEDEIDDLDSGDVDIGDSGKGSIMVGYDFGNTVSIELEAGSSTHNVDYEAAFLEDQDLKISTLGLYVVYRSPGKWYFKGRGGLLSRTLELSPEIGDQDEDSAGLLSIGLGAGVNIVDNFSMEVEFVTIEQGIGSVGFNALYRF